MRFLLLLVVMVLAALALPGGHGAPRRAPGYGRPAPPPHLVRVLRTPQPPKVVRTLGEL